MNLAAGLWSKLQQIMLNKSLMMKMMSMKLQDQACGEIVT